MARADRTTLCPQGHEVAGNLRFCPHCGSYVQPEDPDDPGWTAAGDETPGSRSGGAGTWKRPKWPARLLVVLLLAGIAALVVGVLAGGRGGSEAPAAPPASFPSTVSPASTVAPTAGAPCAPEKVRSGSLSCELTPAGLVWFEVPYASPADEVGLVGIWPRGTPVPVSSFVQVGASAVAAGNPVAQNDAARTDLWCVEVILQNRGTVPFVYDPVQMQLLDPRGNLASTAPVEGLDPPPLERGELLPGGTVASYVCFRRPEVTTGRFAVVHTPAGSLARALLYFDAAGVPTVVTPPG